MSEIGYIILFVGWLAFCFTVIIIFATRRDAKKEKTRDLAIEDLFKAIDHHDGDYAETSKKLRALENAHDALRIRVAGADGQINNHDALIDELKQKFEYYDLRLSNASKVPSKIKHSVWLYEGKKKKVRLEVAPPISRLDKTTRRVIKEVKTKMDTFN